MKALKLLSTIVLVTLFAVTTMAGSVLAAKTIKLHHLNKDDPFDNPTGAMATVFKSLVEAGTNGSVTVQTFPSGQLGKDKDALQPALLNPAFIPSAGLLPSTPLSVFWIFLLPFPI